MNDKLLGVLAGGAVCLGCAGSFAQPQPTTSETQPAPSSTTALPTEKETWKGPFGGTFSASFAFATDYSYRGLSQTQRQVAVQPAFGYETPSIGEKFAVSAYVGAWGSNVNFPGTGTTAEIDLLAGFRAKALDDKLSFDLGYIRYNYLSAPSDLFYDFNEFGLVVGYDFGVAQLSAALRYSPNFFANSGNAWYKWGQVAVPLPFIKLNENVAFKLFGTIGNQYVERFANYGIPWNNYWDWQVGFTVNVYGVDLTIAYVDTNIDVEQCGNTYNCAARAIFTISKSF
ncbi:MAG: TorF family putative porin [Reyranellaceae bacterium]